MNEYDLGLAFEEIEEHLLIRLKKSLIKHTKNKSIENFTKKDWNLFYVDALRGLKEYKRDNQLLFNTSTKKIENMIDEILSSTYANALSNEEEKLLTLMKKGIIPEQDKTSIVINDNKINAIKRETITNMNKMSSYAILRSSEDAYRKIIYNAQIFKATGAGTIWECVDMAMGKFLENGIATITYKNGRNVNISSYAEMSLRTSDKRALLQGEADMRESWGKSYVMVSSYGSCSPLCLPWQGKVYIDDVFGSPSEEEIEQSPYPLLSEAMDGGLYHPNCRHTQTTFYEGFSEVRKETRDDKEISENYKKEQKQRRYERAIRKEKRLSECALEPKDAKLHNRKAKELQAKLNNYIKETNKDGEILRRDRAREVDRVTPKSKG